MLQAALIDNGTYGTSHYFADSAQLRFRRERIGPDWSPKFDGDDLIVVPNGSDHVALYRQRTAIDRLLQRGGSVLCFCGFFTPWLPGNVWVHDNLRPNREVRYHAVNDPLGLLDGVDIEQLAINEHGIRGWWACGDIHTDHADSVVLADTWNRAVLVADTRSTPGLIITTASGPLGDADPSAPAGDGLVGLYRNVIRAVLAQRETIHA